MAEPQKQDQKQNGGDERPAPSLSHRDALSADHGSGRLAEALDKGYDGYVWQEDKSEYHLENVVDNDQSGPLKTIDEDHDPMEDHFIRPDKLDDSSASK